MKNCRIADSRIDEFRVSPGGEEGGRTIRKSVNRTCGMILAAVLSVAVSGCADLVIPILDKERRISNQTNSG